MNNKRDFFAGVTMIVVCMMMLQSCSTETDEESPDQNEATVQAVDQQPMRNPKELMHGQSGIDQQNPEEEQAKIFSFETAIIKYKFEGEMEGVGTYYLGDWGRNVVVVQDVVINSTPARNTFIWKDNMSWFWNHDNPERRVYTSKHRKKETMLSSTMDSHLHKSGYSRLAEEKLAGKICEVYEKKSRGHKIWRWRGIDFKVVMTGGGKVIYHKDIVSFEENAELPQNLYKAPPGYMGR